MSGATTAEQCFEQQRIKDPRQCLASLSTFDDISNPKGLFCNGIWSEYSSLQSEIGSDPEDRRFCAILEQDLLDLAGCSLGIGRDEFGLLR